MSDDQLSTQTTVDAPVETVFAVLADPSTHQAIDGTGWVRESLDGKPLTEVGQIFRMGMYHDNHPNKTYEMANRVTVFDEPMAIAWEPGQEGPDGTIEYGGWIWRYDLAPSAEGTDVTITYDWSGTPQVIRDEIQFPPFDAQHLRHSLDHLAALAMR